MEARDGLQAALPFPPSVNRYWRKWRNRVVLSTKGREYREAVCGLLAPVRCARPPMAGRLALRLDVYPPDRRARDIDNTMKAIGDSLEHAGVYENDSQIDLLVVARREIFKGGKAHVQVEPLPLQRCLLCGHPLDHETHT